MESDFSGAESGWIEFKNHDKERVTLNGFGYFLGPLLVLSAASVVQRLITLPFTGLMRIL